MRISRNSAGVCWAFIAVSVVLAVGLYYIRKYNLDFHQQDYQHDLNNIADGINVAAGVPSPEHLHPGGHNALGFSGVDAFPDTGAQIHFSPVAIFLSLIYLVGGETLIVVFYTVVAGLGFFKFASIFFETSRDRKFVSFAFLCLFPFFLFFINYDLRFYTLLIGLLMLLIYFIDRGSPTLHVLIVVGAMFIIREESYYFALVAAAHLLARGRKRLSAVLFTISVTYLCILYLYFFIVSDYAFEFGPKALGFILAPLILFAAVALDSSGRRDRFDVLARAHRWWNENVASKLGEEGAHLVSLFIWLNVYLAPIWLRAIVLIRVSSLFDRYFVLLFSFVVGMALLLRFWSATKGLRIAVASVSLFLLLTGLTRIGVKVIDFDWKRNGQIWATVAESHSDSLIVTNSKFHQAFWDKNAVAWERLPAESVDDMERFWPENRDRLVRFAERADLFVLEPEGIKVIEGLGVRRLKCEQHRGFSVCT